MPSLFEHDDIMEVSKLALGNKQVKKIWLSPDGITVTFDMKHFPEGLQTTDMNSSLF
jgi:hypothetical protein